MAAQYLNAWRPSAIIAANTALLADIDTGSGAARVTLHDAADVKLAEIPLTDPAGSVNATTGLLTLTPSGRDESADASGTAFYASIRDGNGAVVRSLPCQAGSFAVPGACVLNTLAIVAGGPVELLSITVS